LYTTKVRCGARAPLFPKLPTEALVPIGIVTFSVLFGIAAFTIVHAGVLGWVLVSAVTLVAAGVFAELVAERFRWKEVQVAHRYSSSKESTCYQDV
jgi:hypothetical protein